MCTPGVVEVLEALEGILEAPRVESNLNVKSNWMMEVSLVEVVCGSSYGGGLSVCLWEPCLVCFVL